MVGTKTDVRLTTDTDPKYTSHSTQQARKQHQNAEEKEKEEKDETGRIDEEERKRERQALLEAAKVEERLRREQERLRRENERLQREEERIRRIEAESLEREKKWERIMQEQREKEARQRIEREQRDKERQLLNEYEAWKNRKTRTEKEWTTIVREEIAQILTKELTSRSPLHQAFINMRKSYMDSASKYSPEEMSEYISYGSAMMMQVESEVSQCRQVIELQKLVALIKLIPNDAKNMFYIVNVEKLYAEMVAHIARGGLGSITDEWTMDGRLICSLTEATRVWNSFELCPQEAQVAQEVVTVPWSRKDLDGVQDKRVQREVDARLEHITKKDESLESFMVWLLEVGQMAIELNSDRIKSPIYERAWQELALRIPIQIPKQWKIRMRALEATASPFRIVEHLLAQAKDMMSRTLTYMQRHLERIINGEFYVVAEYARNMLRMERLGQLTNLVAWLSEEIELADIKLKIRLTRGIHPTRKNDVNSFDGMVGRLAGSVEEEFKEGMVNAIDDQNQKNWPGLARGAR